MGHEYTHSVHEYNHLSVWDSPTKGWPHTPVWSADSAVSAHLVVWYLSLGILDHMDNSSIHCICECRLPDKARLTRLDLRVCGQSRINISVTQTLVRC